MKKTAILLFLVSFLFRYADADRVLIDTIHPDNWNVATETDTITSSYDESADWMKVEYELDGGKWIAVYPSTNTKEREMGLLNASAGDAVSFRARGTGFTNNLQIQIHDSNGNVHARNINNITGLTRWNKFVVPFDSLDIWEGESLQKEKITKMAFAVTPSDGRYGTVTIDDIKSYRLQTPEKLTVSSFDFGTPPNELGGNEGEMSHDGLYDPDVSYSRDTANGGIFSLKLDYDLPSDWCGYWIHLGPDEDPDEGNEDIKHLDVSGYTSLDFYIKTTVPGLNIKIEVEDEDGKDEALLNDHLAGGATTSWQSVSIPVSSFTAVDSSKLITLAFVIDDTPSSGTVYIDEIMFVTGDPYTGGSEEVLDPMDMPARISGWQNFGLDEDSGITKTSLESVAGRKGGNAIRLNYEFNRKSGARETDWVVMERDWGLNFSKATHFGLEYRGRGDSNNLEFKIADKNGTIYWRKFFSITDTGGEWKELVIPVKELVLFEKGSDNGNVFTALDLTKINKFEFAVSGKEGSKGLIEFRNLAAYYSSDFSEKRRGKILEEVKVTNNPFAPNSDGIKDTTEFIYILSTFATVELQIFSLKGDLIYDDDTTFFVRGKNSFKWDGKDNSGKLVPNGLYFYVLEANCVVSSDIFKHVIAVIR